ncbi:MAG: hypothetical protein AVDCRST_MAG36-3126, partial [uncultured Nocardioidaceae bacterium]
DRARAADRRQHPQRRPPPVRARGARCPRRRRRRPHGLPGPRLRRHAGRRCRRRDRCPRGDAQGPGGALARDG